MSDAEEVPEFGQWLKAAMKEDGLSYRALGTQLGLTHMAVSAWVNKGTTPHPATQALIEEVLGRTYPGPRPQWRATVVPPTLAKVEELSEEIRSLRAVVSRIAEHLGVSTEDL